MEAALEESVLEDLRGLEALRECLETVPQNVRALLNLRYHDENSSAEIAQRLQRSLAWVRTTLCRVRQQLRQCVEKKLAAKPS